MKRGQAPAEAVVAAMHSKALHYPELRTVVQHSTLQLHSIYRPATSVIESFMRETVHDLPSPALPCVTLAAPHCMLSKHSPSSCGQVCIWSQLQPGT